MAVRKLGFITGVAGEYKGAVFKLNDNERVAIGRDAEHADIVINSNNKRVSRIHCCVMFDAAMNMYCVNDLSKNGTYDAHTKKKLPYGQEVFLARGMEHIHTHFKFCPWR